MCSNSFNLQYDLRSLNKYAILININTLLLSKCSLLVTDLVSSEISVADISGEIFKFIWKPVSKFKRYEKPAALLLLTANFPISMQTPCNIHFPCCTFPSHTLKSNSKNPRHRNGSGPPDHQQTGTAKSVSAPCSAQHATMPYNKTADETPWQCLSCHSLQRSPEQPNTFEQQLEGCWTNNYTS